MSEINLKWDSAEVREGKLQVELEGDPSDEWKQSFEHTVALLGGGRWGEVQLEEESVNVAGVLPGTEDKIRHFLESVIVQANATEQQLRDKQDDDSDEDEDEDSDEQQDEDSDDEHSDGDKEMTARFREFGSEGDGSGDSEAKDSSETKGSSEGKSSASDDDSDEESDSDEDSDSKSDSDDESKSDS